jgi:hypothetical protein
MAVGIGIVCTFVARALLRLIGFFTNLFYWAGEHGICFSGGKPLGLVVVLVP